MQPGLSTLVAKKAENGLLADIVPRPSGLAGADLGKWHYATASPLFFPGLSIFTRITAKLASEKIHFNTSGAAVYLIPHRIMISTKQ